MGLVVQKFGGSSVADCGRIRACAERAIAAKKQGRGVIVVVSAMGKTTDRLIGLAGELCAKPQSRELDMLLATGEQMSVALFAMALYDMGYDAVSFTGAQVGIVTDHYHTKAKIKNISAGRIKAALDEGHIVIVAGFQGVDEKNNITTLGRGGSDTTAVALAAVLAAEVCEIYTDVDGVYTADPRIVKNARKVERITYDEMLELASLGAKVMHSRSIEFAKKYKVPIHVRSSFHDGEGSIIREEVEGMEDIVVSGVALDKNQAKITVHGVKDIPGIAAKVFKPIAEANVNIDMIVQNVSEKGFTDISFTVSTDELDDALAVCNTVVANLGAKGVDSEKGIAKLSVVGIGMRSHAGIAGTMFSALADSGINIEMISTSEIKISVVIDENKGEAALDVLHTAFELETPDTR